MPLPVQGLWKETPLVHSRVLSSISGCQVYLKLENLHPSYSFKYRGISYFVQKAKEIHGPYVHAIVASGGNAGIAAACAARVLVIRCTVFVPIGAAESTLEILRLQGARVVIHGSCYAEAVQAAKELVAREANASVMIPAYEDPVVWEGHSSIVHEIHEQLGEKPDAIFCSVGGAGLLGGIIKGCDDVGWEDVPLVALETIGTDCFYHSMSLNTGRFNASTKTLPPDVEVVKNEEHGVLLAHFNRLWSKASGSLGASEPAPGVVSMSLKRHGKVVTATMPDELSMDALLRFADHHKSLVELACSTTLVPAYNPEFLKRLVDLKKEGIKLATLVFVVCGGFKIDLATASEYRKAIEGRSEEKTWTVYCDDGEPFTFAKQRW